MLRSILYIIFDIFHYYCLPIEQLKYGHTSFKINTINKAYIFFKLFIKIYFYVSYELNKYI